MSLIDFLVNVELDTPRPDYRALLIAARNVTSPVAETPAAPSAFQPHVAAWRTAWQNAGLDPARVTTTPRPHAGEPGLVVGDEGVAVEVTAQPEVAGRRVERDRDVAVAAVSMVLADAEREGVVEMRFGLDTLGDDDRTGALLVGVAEMGDGELDHVKVGVKLVIAVIVAGLVEAAADPVPVIDVVAALLGLRLR